MSAPPSPRARRFDGFEIRPDERRLVVDGRPATLGARAFDLLVALVERRDRLVAKDELLELVWPGVVVEENNLQVQVSALRKLLGAQAITTVPGRGYRFTAAPAGDAPAAAAPLPPAAAAWEPALFGRDDDLAQLAALLAQHRLVSIVGAGGIGKTSVAQALRARAGGDGGAWVDLGAMNDERHVAAGISVALGLGTRGADPLAALVQALRPLALLLVLDNAEHLAAEVARIAQAVLHGCPGVRLLVTSQVPLRVGGEQVHRLDGLALPAGDVGADEALRHAAVALFAERARAADRRFRLEAANVAAVVEVCRRLHGVPLAVELAAARVALLGAGGLLAGLDQRLRLLRERAPARPARQQSLRAALEWSHGLLGATEQAAFRRLGVFAGGFTLEQAQQVLPTPDDGAGLDRWAVLDALAELVDRSLLAVGAQDPPRYALLETPRALALELLAAAGEADACRARHARALAGWFAARDADLLAGRIGMDDWLLQLSPEVDNGREALAWSLAHDARSAIEITPGLLRALTTARLPERAAIADATEPLLDAAFPDALRAAWHQAVGMLVPARPQRRLASLRQAVTIYRRLGRPADVHLSIVSLLGMAEDMPAAEVEALHIELQAIEGGTALPPRSRMLACQAEYFYRYTRSEWAQAEAALLAQVEWARRAGHSDAVDTALSNLADLASTTGDPAMAVQRGRELLQQRSSGRRRYHHELARRNLALSLLLLGETAEPRALAAEGLPNAAAYVMTGQWADALALLAAIERRPRAAAMLCGFADAAYRREDDSRSDDTLDVRRRTEEIARAALGDRGFEQRCGSGEALDVDGASALAFGAVDAG